MLAGAVEFDMEMAMNQELTEQILEVRDGKIAKMNVTTDTMDVEVSGEVNAMGEGESLDESVEAPRSAARSSSRSTRTARSHARTSPRTRSRSATPRWPLSTT